MKKQSSKIKVNPIDMRLGESKSDNDYPKITDKTCPSCKSPVIKDKFSNVEWTDAEGNPVETSGFGLYCSNTNCSHNIVPIEDEDFEFPST